MRTSKPCSTISYNTAEFLTRKLNDLIKRGHIDFWCFIEHEPEEDEEKKHKHLYIFPSTLIDTNQLREELKENDVNNPLKPLGCMPFQSSKFADWYLYVVHDSSYLSSKGQARKYHYKDDDIIRSDNAVFNPLFPDEKRIDSKRLLSIPDIFLYSTRSDDDTPHFAVAVTADTEISYHDDNDKLCRMNDRYKAVIEFKGSSAGELKAVSGAFTVNAPDYPAPEPEHPAINEHPENIVGYSTENNSIQQNNTVTASDNKSQN